MAEAKCGYRVNGTSCGGAPTHVVKGYGKFGYAKTTAVCAKHVHKAMEKWNFETVDPIGDGK